MRLYLPGLPKVGYDIQPVVVGRCQEAPQVLKLQHCFQWPVIIPELNHYHFLSLVLLQALSLPLQSPCVERYHYVAAVQLRIRYGHVIDRSVGLRAVPFLQNHYCVMHVTVRKVDSEVGMHHRPTLAVLHWEPDGDGRFREGDHIYPGIRCRLWCNPLSRLNLLKLHGTHT